MTFSWFPVLLLGVPVIIAVAIALSMALEWLGMQTEKFSAGCQGRFNWWRERATLKARYERDQEAFFLWLAGRAGSHQVPGAVDETLVEAQRQADFIHLLVESEVPQAVSQCVQVHRAMAKITGVHHMGAIQYEPELLALRSRCVWLLTHTTRLLDGYPLKFEDPQLLHNAILLRKRALPTCCRCPYVRCGVRELPKLCPTAELFQVGEVQHVQG